MGDIDENIPNIEQHNADCLSGENNEHAEEEVDISVRKEADAIDLSKSVTVINTTDDNREDEAHSTIIEDDKEILAAESTDEEKCDSRPISLDTLPPEIFLTICSYLPASFILTCLALVCKSFRDLLMDDSTWKIRISKRCQKLYPRVPEANFNWKLACMEREDATRRWSQVDSEMDSYVFKDNVHSAVDAVHLLDHGNLLVSGSRDRHLIFWDLAKLDPDLSDYEDQSKLLIKDNAHKGWIWTIASRQHFIATGAWDATIKIWDVGPNCEEIRKIGCKSAILCSNFVNQTIVAGGYDQHTYFIDSRTGGIIQRTRHHRRSVLCLNAASDYVITGSEDRTVCVYDQRAQKAVKVITLANFPMSISRFGNQVLVGDKVGLVHLIDCNDGKFDMVKTYEVGHSSRVTGIQHGYGCTITCSVDKTIQILEPCDNPAILATLKLHTQEVAGISYLEGTLASAGSDCQIGVWRPRQNFRH